MLQSNLQGDVSVNTHGVVGGPRARDRDDVSTTEGLLRSIDGHTDATRLLGVLVSGSKEDALGRSLGSFKENLDLLGSRDRRKTADKDGKLLLEATVSSKEMEAVVNLSLYIW